MLLGVGHVADAAQLLERGAGVDIRRYQDAPVAPKSLALATRPARKVHGDEESPINVGNDTRLNVTLLESASRDRFCGHKLGADRRAADDVLRSVDRDPVGAHGVGARIGFAAGG